MIFIMGFSRSSKSQRSEFLFSKLRNSGFTVLLPNVKLPITAMGVVILQCWRREDKKKFNVKVRPL